MLAQNRSPTYSFTVKMKCQHSLSVPLRPDWWGDNSDIVIVAWQKEAASVLYSLYRPVYTVRTAK